MSFWPSYIKERMGWEFLERPEGFLCWSRSAPYLRIEEIYVLPELRGKGFGADLVRYVEEIARQEGMQGLWTQVWAHGESSTSALTAAIRCGFRVRRNEGGAIILTKEFGG